MNCMGLSGSQSKNSGMHTTTAHMIQKLRRKALKHEQARPRTIQNDHGDQQKAMRAPGHLSPYMKGAPDPTKHPQPNLGSLLLGSMAWGLQLWPSGRVVPVRGRIARDDWFLFRVRVRRSPQCKGPSVPLARNPSTEIGTLGPKLGSIGPAENVPSLKDCVRQTDPGSFKGPSVPPKGPSDPPSNASRTASSLVRVCSLSPLAAVRRFGLSGASLPARVHGTPQTILAQWRV